MRTPADINIRQFLQKSYLDRDELTDEALVQRIRTLRRQLEQNPRKNARLQSAVKGTWFRISDRNCEVRSVDQVLNCQAYLLFYERLVCSKDEGSMHSGTRSNTLFIGHFWIRAHDRRFAQRVSSSLHNLCLHHWTHLFVSARVLINLRLFYPYILWIMIWFRAWNLWMTFLTKQFYLFSQISEWYFLLHKQPFITAHFKSSLYILCITARWTAPNRLWSCTSQPKEKKETVEKYTFMLSLTNLRACRREKSP